ncbi:polysaccharide deacetylase family protein [Bacillus haikouensis]|nr:polysaccharide deacetylase family protein [Bacillus haikouensis]
MSGLFILIVIIVTFFIYSIISTIVIRKMDIKIIRRVPHERTIALTFDDGPHPLHTSALLEILKRHGVKATFFVVGENAEQNPGLIKRMVDEGHSLGVHHYRHISSWFLTPWGLKKQLERTNEVLKRITGEGTYLYRPPWGHLNFSSLMFANRYRIIIWSHIFKDWKVKECKEHLSRRLNHSDSEGAVFVLHDNGATLGADEDAPKYMVECVDAFIKDALERDIRFISLDEAFQ